MSSGEESMGDMTYAQSQARHVKNLATAINFDKAPAIQRKRIDAGLFIAENIEAIHGAFPDTTLRPDSLNEIQRARSVLLSQVARLDANSAKYVVAGLEKAGKTAFINAYIGIDLFPTHGERCTYAVTVIRVSKGGRFEVTIRPKLCSISQFQSREAELGRSAKMGGPMAIAAAQDLEQIKTLRSYLEAIITGKQALQIKMIGDRSADSSFDFSNKKIDDIELARACLKAVVAGPIAYAVQEVEVDISIQNTQAISGDDFELVDLPGLDSGLTIHQELVKSTMANADAIIFVQNISNPTLQKHANKLLSYAEYGDLIKFREKIFVFLNRCDEKPDAVINDNYDSAIREWRKHDIPASNVFVGSAAGQLLLMPNNLSREILATFLSTHDLNNERDIEAAASQFLQRLKQSMALYNRRMKTDDITGFRRIIARLDQFKRNEQAVNASKRIEESLREIKSNSRYLVQTLSSKLKNQSRGLDVLHLEEEMIFHCFLEGYIKSARVNVLEAIRRKIGPDSERSANEYDIKVKEKINAIFDSL